MKSTPRSIYELFNAKHRYVVPLFQRQYVWSKENQWEPLWEDILNKTMDRLDQTEPSPHFMGAMVFDQISTFGNQIHAHTVIDGQQRLTTLQIFLAVFRNVARKYDLDEYVDEIGSHVLNKGITDDQRTEDGRKIELYKVFPTKADQNQFCDVIDSVSREDLETKYPPVKERRKIKPRPTMVEAYLYFQESLEDYLNDPDISAGVNLAQSFYSFSEQLRFDSQPVKSYQGHEMLLFGKLTFKTFDGLNNFVKPLHGRGFDLLHRAAFVENNEIVNGAVFETTGCT
jgi:uncharacterized protein with ParB-like and HNH nuclease domain